MPADPLIISHSNFNTELKNYLRDFYVYQFKEKGRDFKKKGTKKDSIVSDPSFNRSLKRIYSALCEGAGLHWKARKNGDGSRRIYCLTTDSRKLTNGNPFFDLYKFCGERSNINGLFFYFLIALTVHLSSDIFEYITPAEDDFESFCSFIAGKIYTEDLENSENPSEEFSKVFKGRRYESTEERERFDKLKNGKLPWRELTAKEVEYFAPCLIPAVKKLSPYELSAIQKSIIRHLLHNTLEIEDDKIITHPTVDITNEYLLSLLRFESGVDFSFENYLKSVNFMGLIEANNNSINLCDTTADKLLCGVDKEKFFSMVAFFSNIAPLGELGNVILKRLGCRRDSHIRYKHNYIQKALNDYNIADILTVINHNRTCSDKYWLLVEYRNASFADGRFQKIICYPIEIRESVLNGRQHVICYFPEKKNISALRIDFIDTITIGKLKNEPEDLNDNLSYAEDLINHTWGTSFPGFAAGEIKNTLKELKKVEIVVFYKEDEPFIINRIKRETRRLFDESQPIKVPGGYHKLISGDFSSETEVLYWARSFIQRIVSVKVNGEDYPQFITCVENMQKIHEFHQLPSDSNSYTLNSAIDDDCSDFIALKDERPNRMVFNEMFGKEFEALIEVLDECLANQTEISEETLKTRYLEKLSGIFDAINSKTHGTEKKDIKVAVQRRENLAGYVFEKFIDNGRLTFQYKTTEGAAQRSFFDLIPFTKAEIQWVHNILCNPLCKCFFSKEEISALKEKFSDQGLFDINDVVLYDQFTELDGYYNDGTPFNVFRDICQAISENKKAKLKYTDQHNHTYYTVITPICFEFTKRENKFRLFCQNKSGKIRKYNLERIEAANITDEGADKNAPELLRNYMKENQKRITVIFSDRKNTAERILTEFSPWEKTCVKQDDLYRMTLNYDLGEYKEIVIRLLSYGDNILISDDDGPVREEFRMRIEKQIELIAERLNEKETEI